MRLRSDVMRPRRLRNAGRRIVAPVRRALTATVLVAGLALMSGPGCKQKEQPKKPTPAKCKPCAKPKPYIDSSKLTFRTMQTSVVKGMPIILIDQDGFARKIYKAQKKKQKVFSFKGPKTFTLGTVTKIDGTGFDLSLNTKKPKTVRIGFSKPQYVNIGAVPFVLYAEYPTKKYGPSVLVTYPQEMF